MVFSQHSARTESRAVRETVSKAQSSCRLEALRRVVSEGELTCIRAVLSCGETLSRVPLDSSKNGTVWCYIVGVGSICGLFFRFLLAPVVLCSRFRNLDAKYVFREPGIFAAHLVESMSRFLESMRFAGE